MDMVDMENMEEVSYSSSELLIVNPNCLCLICGDQLKVRVGSQADFATVFRELFQTFSEYMEWEETEKSQSFNFQSEVFPFCKECKSVLEEMYSLNAEIGRVLAKIQQLALDTTVKVVSCCSKNLRADDDQFQQAGFTCSALNAQNVELRCSDGSEILYNADKVQFYRKLILERYVPSVVIEGKVLVPKTEAFETESNCSEASSVVSISGHSEKTDEEFSVAEPQVEAPSSSTQQPEPKVTEAKSTSNGVSVSMGRLTGRVQLLEPNKYIFDNKFKFQLLPNSNWQCINCERQFYHGVRLENHLLQGCAGKEYEPPAPEIKTFDRKAPGPKSKRIVQNRVVDPSSISQQFHCHFTAKEPPEQPPQPPVVLTKSIEYQQNPITKLRELRKKPEIEVDESQKPLPGTIFTSNGFMFEAIADGKFKCCHCSFTAVTKVTLLSHITVAHNVSPTSRGPVKRFYNPRTPVSAMPAIKRGRRPAVPINKFAFRGHTFTRIPPHGNFQCDGCAFLSGDKKEMLKHIKDKGYIIPRKSFMEEDLDDGTDEVDYKGFKYRKMRDGFFNCLTCAYSTAKLFFMLSHIRKLHVDPSLVETRVAPPRVYTSSSSISSAASSKLSSLAVKPPSITAPSPCKIEVSSERDVSVLTVKPDIDALLLTTELPPYDEEADTSFFESMLLDTSPVKLQVPTTSKPHPPPPQTGLLLPSAKATVSLLKPNKFSQETIAPFKGHVTPPKPRPLSQTELQLIERLFNNPSFKSNTEKVGTRLFSFKRKYGIELTDNLKWSCVACRKEISDEPLDLGNHFKLHDSLGKRHQQFVASIESIWEGPLKSRVKRLTDRKFVLDNKVHFELTGARQWFCHRCRNNVKDMPLLAEHLLSGCKKGVVTSENAPTLGMRLQDPNNTSASPQFPTTDTTTGSKYYQSNDVIDIGDDEDDNFYVPKSNELEPSLISISKSIFDEDTNQRFPLLISAGYDFPADEEELDMTDLSSVVKVEEGMDILP